MTSAGQKIFLKNSGFAREKVLKSLELYTFYKMNFLDSWTIRNVIAGCQKSEITVFDIS